MEGAGFQLVLGVANHGEGGAEVKRLVAALPREALSLTATPLALPSAFTLRMNSFPVMHE